MLAVWNVPVWFMAIAFVLPVAACFWTERKAKQDEPAKPPPKKENEAGQAG